MESPFPSAPVACSLDQGGLAEREQRWLSLAERAFAGAEGTPDGLWLSFHPMPGVEAELADLARLERDCCAFARWSVRRAGESVVLEVSGASQEAVAAVREMFTQIRGMAPADPVTSGR